MNKEFDSKREPNHTLVELMGWKEVDAIEDGDSETSSDLEVGVGENK